MEASDILLIVIAFCVLWITAFICWFIYHLAMTIKAIHEVMQEVRWSLEKVEQAMQAVKVKMEKGSDHLRKLTGHVKKAVENVIISKE